MRYYIVLMILIVFGLTNLIAQPAVLIADNGKIKVKLDLTRGGAISYISQSGSDRNLVNIHDEGRYIQQSYYAGKNLDRRSEGQAPRWSPWSWNPIQVGDDYCNRAQILVHKQTRDTLYVKCTPMQWDMNNKPAEAEMEQWNVLMGNVLKVHCKLTCHRTDTIYGENIENDQELPAVYPISALDKLYTYLGNKPFTNDTISTPKVINLSSGFWGIYPLVPEHWMAFTDKNNWGLGVFNFNCVHFYAGMSGTPGGEAHDKSTSYIAPSTKAILNKNSVFEYDYYIIIGTVDEIRTKVYELNSSCAMK
jgi:hypothetical protein